VGHTITSAPKDQLKEGDLVVTIIHDHGTRYLGKMFNEDWLRERGFLKDEKLNAGSILENRERQEIVTIDAGQSVLEAINTIKMLNISQLPVTQHEMVVGKVTEGDILNALLENNSAKSFKVADVMTKPFPRMEGL